ncbi:Subtilisin-like protease SBT5.4 [Ananas comosus]|uniref:Subtilisin-like protease SBT5.4 n=1 Tax=Ananas comosus TaxID=4615 RepID=A0A199V6X8_ANACO|nr:Subtilisin-like protease SBT5.4 [Ananas comosus]
MRPDPPIPAENINSPPISAPNLNKTQTVTRTVRNVGPPATYRVPWTPPKAVNMTVSPTELKFDRTGEEKTYEVTYVPREKEVRQRLGKHHVRSPVVVQAIDA